MPGKKPIAAVMGLVNSLKRRMKKTNKPTFRSSLYSFTFRLYSVFLTVFSTCWVKM